MRTLDPKRAMTFGRCSKANPGSRSKCVPARTKGISTSWCALGVRLPIGIGWNEPCHGIDIAGNLSHGKAEYVYRLAERFPKADINLYGPKYDRRNGKTAWYRGIVAPDELPDKLEGRFGLIWDGDSLDTCGGYYGKYLTVNNPHKLSLYLAADKPVIIWNKAALAPFVVEQGVGVAVESLQEAMAVEYGMTQSEYARMVRRASQLGQKLREGWFTREVMTKVQAVLPSLRRENKER